MTLLGLLAATYSRTRQAVAARSAYRDLRELDPRLLRDIGLRLEQGRVFPMTGVNELAPEDSSSKQAKTAPAATLEPVSEKKLAYNAEPEGVGG
ncbi:hypothetical protein BGP75_05205 [Motiliproteus sp. MSK22-1]|nr:hypothetical protein BGP75_05205 [Motiliproteus sp. MSK22-1]